MSKFIFLFSIKSNYCCEFDLFYDGFLKEDIAKYQALNTRSNFEIQQRYMWDVISNKAGMFLLMPGVIEGRHAMLFQNEMKITEEFI